MARKIFTFSPNRAAVEMKRRQRQQDLLETGEIQRLLGADAEQRLREHRQEPTVKTPKRGYNHEPTAKELAYAFDNGAYKAVVRRLKILGLNNPDAFISSLIDAKFDLLNIQEFGHFGDETTESLFDPPDIVIEESGKRRHWIDYMIFCRIFAFSDISQQPQFRVWHNRLCNLKDKTEEKHQAGHVKIIIYDLMIRQAARMLCRCLLPDVSQELLQRFKYIVRKSRPARLNNGPKVPLTKWRL
jgi:hypothetical protein